MYALRVLYSRSDDSWGQRRWGGTRVGRVVSSLLVSLPGWCPVVKASRFAVATPTLTTGHHPGGSLASEKRGRCACPLVSRPLHFADWPFFRLPASLRDRARLSRPAVRPPRSGLALTAEPDPGRLKRGEGHLPGATIPSATTVRARQEASDGTPKQDFFSSFSLLPSGILEGKGSCLVLERDVVVFGRGAWGRAWAGLGFILGTVAASVVTSLAQHLEVVADDLGLVFLFA